MRLTTILADTGPLYALADSGDQYHSRAIRELESLQKAGVQIVVLYPTLMESYTLVMRFLGLSFAHTWLNALLKGAGHLNPTPKDYLESVTLINSYSDQNITLFDALIAVTSKRLNLPVWTFDSDFDVMKANVWRG